MITGDNILTACHVATSLRLSKKTILALTKYPAADEELWVWQSTDKSIHFDLQPKNLNQFLKDYDLALTGEVITFSFVLFLN